MTELTVGDISPRVQYTADGTQAGFAFPFPAFAASDLAVYFDDGQVPDPFTVSGVGQSAGGSIDFASAPAAGTRITIARQMPIERASDFQEAGDFRAAAINQELDRLTMMVQQVDEKTGRAAGVPVHALAGDLTMPDPDPGKYLRWNALGTKLEAVAPLDASNIVVTGFAESLLDDADAAGARATLGLGAAAVESVAAGGTAGLLRSDGDGSTLTGVGAAADNALINGCMSVDQRGDSAAVNDGAYCLDRWIVLSDGNGVVTANRKSTDLPPAARRAVELKWAIANKQAGLVQIVEGVNCAHLIGGAASFSFWAKASGLANLRAAVLAWDGAEDAVTSDAVSVWNGAGTDPAWAANWTAENAPANLDVSGGAWAEYKIETIAIDTAGANNVAVVIWLDDTDAAVDDWLLVTDVQLEAGASASAFRHRPVTLEEVLCRRYYWRSKTGSTTPIATGFCQNTIKACLHVPLPVEMRATPTVAFGAQAGFDVYSGAAAPTTTAMASVTGRNTVENLWVDATVASGLTAGHGAVLAARPGTSNYIEADAEL